MEKNFVLKAEVRDSIGTHSSGKIRDKGKIPAVVYGHKKDPVSVIVDRHEFH